MRSPMLMLAIAAMCGWAADARAADAAKPETIEIGGETKPAIATVRSVVAGDVACYVTLDDGSGEAVEHLAVFEICEREAELVGTRVKLAYTVENVMAAECQGDPECSKSEQAVLVSEANVVK